MKTMSINSNYSNVEFIEKLYKDKCNRLKHEGLKAKDAVEDFNEGVINTSLGDTGILSDFITKILFFLVVMSNRFVSAFANGGLSDIYASDAFVGNTKWLEKFNWVGTVVQAFISVFALLIAVIVIMQILITVIYFANRNLWDAVADMKKEKSGLINYTFNGAFQGGAKSVASRGSDVIMTYIMLLLPNIKKYSEMGSESADQDWTLSTWLMGTAINKIILLLVVSMAYSGSLMKAYMMVVDGVGVLADEIVSTDLEGIIENQINKNNGKNYQFAVGSTGIGLDDLQGTIAHKLYTEILKRSDDTSTNARNVIGSAVENYVTKNLKGDVIASYIVPKVTDVSSMTDSEWERVKIEVVANTATGATNALTVRASDLGLENSKGKATNYHIYFTLNRRDDTTSYWKVPEGE